ncbi:MULTISPECIES: YqaA family protein [Dinoroseobacter]|nr:MULTISPECIES: YqaA family protein [Dinoroseobacter]MDD9717322.1 DedA family protein [Dinoroseobacter sp. PD6]URF46913.1 DedA family protein [Dinoroseobacter shibae]URF51224.1 DedA family protein [Dinoroseobacter shibae]
MTLFETMAGILAVMFGTAFGAATILPLQSEIVFTAFQVQAAVPLWALLLVASVGNTLGSVLNYALGWQIPRFKDKRWFPVTEAQLDKAQRWFAKYGKWSLLLSWAPLGDAITVVAGMMRTRLFVFIALVGFAKTARYIALAALVEGGVRVFA